MGPTYTARPDVRFGPIVLKSSGGRGSWRAWSNGLAGARMISAEREWHGKQGASADELGRVRSAAPVELPDAYYRLLAFSNGGEGPLGRQPLYFRLDPVDVAVKTFERGLNHEFFPGFVIIGSNGAGEYVAFDVRHGAPWPVVSIDMTNIDLRETVWPIAASFDEFIGLIGVEHAE